MTREEAIKIINCYDIGFYDLSGEKIPADKLADAFDMAIEALQEPKTIITMEPPYRDDKGIAMLFKGKDDKLILEEVKEVAAVVRCKNCKYFTLNFVENVDGIPLIMAHEVCSFWGDGCKTSQEGFCSFGERKDE